MGSLSLNYSDIKIKVIYGVSLMKNYNNEDSRFGGCLVIVIVLLVVIGYNIYSKVSDFFEERKQEELNTLYLSHIDSIRPTLEPKLFTIKDLEQSDFYKKYKDDFNDPLNAKNYNKGRISIDRSSEAFVYLDFYKSSDYRFDIMEQEFPGHYLSHIEFESTGVLADEDKQFVADLLTTIGYSTTVKHLENVGNSNLDDVQSEYIGELKDNACYQQNPLYSLYDQVLIDGEWENIYDLERACEFSCNFYPFTEVWDELEDIESDF